jgi:hypothetical protein
MDLQQARVLVENGNWHSPFDFGDGFAHTALAGGLVVLR